LLEQEALKNVGPIRHCEPPHAHSAGVATGTVARRLRIDVHDDNDDNDNACDRGDRYGPMDGPNDWLTANLPAYCGALQVVFFSCVHRRAKSRDFIKHCCVTAAMYSHEGYVHYIWISRILRLCFAVMMIYVHDIGLRSDVIFFDKFPEFKCCVLGTLHRQRFKGKVSRLA